MLCVYTVQVLELLKPLQNKSKKSGLLPENIAKNRSVDIIPGNSVLFLNIMKNDNFNHCVINALGSVNDLSFVASV